MYTHANQHDAFVGHMLNSPIREHKRTDVSGTRLLRSHGLCLMATVISDECVSSARFAIQERAPAMQSALASAHTKREFVHNVCIITLRDVTLTRLARLSAWRNFETRAGLSSPRSFRMYPRRNVTRRNHRFKLMKREREREREREKQFHFLFVCVSMWYSAR